MSGQDQVFSESIDDVLTAVQETPRGRWFLEAYAARVKSEGTSTILSAIAKLETNLDRMSTAGASTELLEKARSAIAAARQEIAAFEPQVAKLSTEAQLFSTLAELSRKAFSATDTSSGLGKGVERALKLVADLDRDLDGSSKQNNQTVEFTPPPRPAVQYFKQDEEIFEPAPPSAPKAVVKPIESAELSNKGAKLTIRRSQAINADATSETLSEKTARADTVATADLPDVPTPPEPSRIVIIRRKASETITVPLVDTEVPREIDAA